MSVLDRSALQQTVAAIAAVQAPDGHIPWVPGGKADPWNMVEAAMALDVGGRHKAARRVYRWLVDRQLPHGGWHAYYLGDEVLDPAFDTNVSAYFATGVWHHFLATGNVGFLAQAWPIVAATADHVVEFQHADGRIAWRADDPEDGALLTGSSSVHFSLRCAAQMARRLGYDRPEWEIAADALAEAITLRENDFLDKRRWAMDWYYPILGGVLRGAAARERVEQRWDEFVVPGLGVRCVADRPWVTAAETCELALALDAIGDSTRARELLRWVQFLRHTDGSYWCGMNFEGDRFDRRGEHFTADQPTWNSAAVVLAAHALDGTGPTASFFRDRRLPQSVAVSSAGPAASLSSTPA